jgi:hypothetical protein
MNTNPLADWRAANPDHERAPQLNPRQKWEKHDTRKTAIAAKCWDCMGGTADYATGVREEIRACTCGPGSPNPCSLWDWRPYR